MAIGTASGITKPPPGSFNGYMAPASSYADLAGQAGFNDLTNTDVTDAFHATARRWLMAASDLEHDLRAVLGDEVYAEKLASRSETLEAIEAGEIRRLRITATA